jgi:hypothetical protein
MSFLERPIIGFVNVTTNPSLKEARYWPLELTKSSHWKDVLHMS